jgi:hypothetical protein
LKVTLQTSAAEKFPGSEDTYLRQQKFSFSFFFFKNRYSKPQKGDFAVTQTKKNLLVSLG